MIYTIDYRNPQSRFVYEVKVFGTRIHQFVYNIILQSGVTQLNFLEWVYLAAQDKQKNRSIQTKSFFSHVIIDL